MRTNYVTRVAVLLLAAPALADGPTPSPRPAPLNEQAMGFEASRGGKPLGWRGHPAASVTSDSDIKRSGAYAVRLRGASGVSLVSVTYAIPIDFKARSVELRGWLRRTGGGTAKLWMRQDSRGNPAGLNFGLDDPPPDTWSEHSIRLPIRSEADTLVFGVQFAGPGVGWADDLELLADGKPLKITKAPAREDPR